ncbi:polynucleotide kinase-phosphatase [Ornithinimicrobium sp. Y1694]|uniref:polynucleotide kinase-phosphatase n=1 Tax=Ornithinimicrobium sp. Y1694 TaxID=3418590 RepID=UPI003CFA98C5
MSPREIRVPELSLVVLIGASGAGKSTFAARAFGPFETISSDYCRGLVSNDENDQSASADAFALLHHLAGVRLRRGLLTVIDATNVSRQARAELVKVARDHDVLPVAIVLDPGLEVSLERNRTRPDRDFGEGPVRRQHKQLGTSVRGLHREGFRGVHVLTDVADIDSAVIVREPLLTDLRDRTGPFDIIGDVHGCLDELVELLTALGYAVTHDDQGRPVDAVHPEGRIVVFVGDLVDRGPNSVGVLRLAMGMHAAGHALAVPGNHEAKLVRALDGANVKVSHGLETTLAELAQESEEFRQEVRDWCYGLVSHLMLDGGDLVVAHAGLKEAYHGRASGRVRSFALYGDTTGETDEYGLPVRYPWAEDYRGRAAVVYGHTPTPTLEWINNTLCLDTGCAFGGRLSALRWPERETVQANAHAVHYEPVKPFPVAGAEGPQRAEGELRLEDVTGRRRVQTQELGVVDVSAENAAGALEVMSRFALHPRLLPYLPPTMAPVAASRRDGYLEHPEEAFEQYARWGVGRVVCEEKHMGSRAVVHLARLRDGADDGAVYTRTGRSFFDPDLTAQLLARIRRAIASADLPEGLGEADRLLLDAELLPWSAKAEALLREQYAAVGAAARLALPETLQMLEQAQTRGLDVHDIQGRTRERWADAQAYDQAWQRYVWPTSGLEGVQLAPFQVLAAGDRVLAGREHTWHLEVADRLVAADPELFRTTRRLVVDTTDESSRAEGVAWWEDLTAAGGEGMVLKPAEPLARPQGKLVQAGLKVRGREYLRIIYGPDYTRPEHLDRLRDRGLGRKRALAIREYALGLEALERWVASEPLWRVHEAVFAILALESEPVDPRL